MLTDCKVCTNVYGVKLGKVKHVSCPVCGAYQGRMLTKLLGQFRHSERRVETFTVSQSLALSVNHSPERHAS